MKKLEQRVPNLRFKGFTDDWEQRKLGEVSSKVSNRNKTNLRLPVFTNSAEYGIISQEKFFDKQIATKTDNYYIVKNNDFVYNPRISKLAPYGPIRRNLLGTIGLISPLYYVFRPHSVNLAYLEFYFKSSKWYKFMYQNGDSGARSDRFSIKDSNLNTMPIRLPSIKEQKQIGELLEKFEKSFYLQQRKLDLLKQLKKGMLQKMFADKDSKQPILRFKGFHDDWEQRKLGETVFVNSGKDYKGLQKGNIPVYGTGGYMLSVNKYLSNKDAIGIGRKGTINNPYILKAPFWTVDTLFYAIPQNQSDIEFMNAIFQNVNWHKYDESTGVPSLSKSTINQVKVYTTSLREQAAIGSLLHKIEKTISLQHQKLAKYQSIKKSLLQQMFI